MKTPSNKASRIRLVSMLRGSSCYSRLFWSHRPLKRVAPVLGSLPLCLYLTPWRRRQTRDVCLCLWHWWIPHVEPWVRLLLDLVRFYWPSLLGSLFLLVIFDSIHFCFACHCNRPNNHCWSSFKDVISELMVLQRLDSELLCLGSTTWR